MTDGEPFPGFVLRINEFSWVGKHDIALSNTMDAVIRPIALVNVSSSAKVFK